MNDKLYKLMIIDVTGNSYEIHGGSALLDAWRSYSEISFEQAGKVVIQGFTDSASRDPMHFAIDYEVIKGMILVSR